jgi:hypothetical protein
MKRSLRVMFHTRTNRVDGIESIAMLRRLFRCDFVSDIEHGLNSLPFFRIEACRAEILPAKPILHCKS